MVLASLILANPIWSVRPSSVSAIFTWNLSIWTGYNIRSHDFISRQQVVALVFISRATTRKAFLFHWKTLGVVGSRTEHPGFTNINLVKNSVGVWLTVGYWGRFYLFFRCPPNEPDSKNDFTNLSTRKILFCQAKVKYFSWHCFLGAVYKVAHLCFVSFLCLIIVN